MNRFNVTIERDGGLLRAEFIVYAESQEEAGAKAVKAFTGKVVKIEPLPALLDEKVEPIIDYAPPRETQK